MASLQHTRKEKSLPWLTNTQGRRRSGKAIKPAGEFDEMCIVNYLAQNFHRLVHRDMYLEACLIAELLYAHRDCARPAIVIIMIIVKNW